jgi:tungstate transport system ATP-binding protein
VTPPPAYRLTGVVRSYGTDFRLRVPELEVAAGEVVCLVGPNGAGKSTLLRLLTGLEQPTAGVVEFDGRPLHRPPAPPAVLRRIAHVPQRPLLLAGTVGYNVGYGMRVRGRRSAPGAVRGVLDRLGIARLADRSAATLSGGECQLVGVARAVVLEPDVLLLDEPTASLDPARVAAVEGAVLALRERRTTIVWATHSLFQARRVADAVGLLLDGSVVEVAPTEAFFERPADERTARFTRGEMVY